MNIQDIISNLFVFVLASFVGIEVIRHVSPLLHTPLMSLTNAISAISIVGSLLLSGEKGNPTYAIILGSVAVCSSVINIVGGYLITHRMLIMFKERNVKKGDNKNG